MTFQLNSVLLLDGIDKVCGEILRSAGIQVKTAGKLTKEELIEELKNHDAVVVRSATKVTADVLNCCDRLKVVGRAGTGVDNIDVGAATKNGILVMNTPGGNTLSAAEHTCALICSLSRSIPLACASLKTGAWDRKKLMGNELYGKVLAIIGLGRIGREVSTRMKSFGMTVIGYDPIISPEMAAEWGIQYYSLEEIWPQADYITVHTPLIPQTRNLIGESSLAACKPTVKIVNVARGGIVDEKALLKALDANKCGGAALDVFEEEPPKDLTLVQNPKVICTPHLGANTYEAQQRVAMEIAQQFIDMSTGRPLLGVVNVPALAKAGSDLARPWIQLASYLGSIAYQLVKAKDSTITIELIIHGKEANSIDNLLGPAVQMGTLQHVESTRANLINAPTIAKEIGIQFSINKCIKQNPAGIHESEALILKAKSNTGSFSITGSILGQEAVLYAIDDCTWTPGLLFGQNMLFFRSDPTTFPLTDIVTALQNHSLTALASSTPGKLSIWHVARIETKVESLPPIANTELVAKLLS